MPVICRASVRGDLPTMTMHSCKAIMITKSLLLLCEIEKIDQRCKLESWQTPERLSHMSWLSKLEELRCDDAQFILQQPRPPKSHKEKQWPIPSVSLAGMSLSKCKGHGIKKPCSDWRSAADFCVCSASEIGFRYEEFSPASLIGQFSSFEKEKVQLSSFSVESVCKSLMADVGLRLRNSFSVGFSSIWSFDPLALG